MCLAHKDLLQRQRKYLYKLERNAAKRALFRALTDYETVKMYGGKKRTRLQFFHEICRVLLKYDHLVKNFNGKFAYRFKNLFEYWQYNGMSKQTARMYMKKLSIF